MATMSPAAESVERLRTQFDRQRVAFDRDPVTGIAERRELLSALAGAVVAHRAEIQEAMSSDFGFHPPVLTDLPEVLGVAGRAAYAIEHLETWAAPQPRHADPVLYGTGVAEMRFQPKGVVGVMTPWNFPFDLSLGPLVDILAAGNRAILKPSEHTPACGEVLAELVAATFDPARVDVAIGDIELARAFPTLAWDHLMYTGGTAVGRKVAAAAAPNLVPLTLELGGKCPALLAPGHVDTASVANVIGVKGYKSGQMCISVDHVLVPREEVERFVELASAYVRDELLGPTRAADVAGIINEHHVERLGSLLDEARAAGARVIELEDAGALDRTARQLPLTLVIDPPHNVGLMDEEVFGPILPVVPYDGVEDAITHMRSGDRPLGVYVYGDQELADRVFDVTSSGAFCVNAAAMHGALPSLGFGGSGASGHGRHHGLEGFREFSNARAVFVRGEGDAIDTFVPPYDARSQAFVDGALG